MTLTTHPRDWTDTELARELADFDAQSLPDDAHGYRDLLTAHAAHAATGIGEEDREPPPSVWDRWSLRAAAWTTPARFWSIYLAVLAAGVAVGLWLRS